MIELFWLYAALTWLGIALAIVVAGGVVVILVKWWRDRRG